MGQEIMKELHWDINKVLSKQRNINVIIGQRGVGKTYTTVQHCIKRALKYGEEFLYIRRFESELEEMGPQSIFSPFAEEFGVPFKVVGKDVYAGEKIVGHIGALSTSHKIKGATYQNVKYLIFDEFIEEVGMTKELKGEIFKFYNLLETVFRMRDFIVFLLANAISFEGCYKYELQLSLPLGDNEFWYHPTKSILVQLVKNTPYEEAKMKSPLGQLINGTAFAKYAVYNEFYGDNYAFVKKRTGTFYEKFSFSFKGKKYGMFISGSCPVMIIDYSITDSLPTYQIKDEEMTDEGVRILSRSRSPVITYIRAYLDSGNLYYQNIKIKNELFNFLIKFI